MTDQRKSARRILKVRAVVAMEGQPPVLCRTMDIGASGVSITVPHPLHSGQGGQVAFDVLIEGKPVTIQSRVRVIHCIFSSDEFRAGFQFMNLDPNATAQLGRFLR